MSISDKDPNLETPVQHHDCFIEFLLEDEIPLALQSHDSTLLVAYDVGDDSREQQALLMLVRALL